MNTAKQLSEKGQVLLLSMFALTTVLFTVLFVIGGAQLYYQNSQFNSDAEKATALAEAGIDKAVASLNATDGEYTGEEETDLGEGSFDTKVTTLENSNKLIEATGFVPNKASSRVKKTINIQATTGTGISFNYAMQIGTGGINLQNGGIIQGTLYSNGNVVFGNNTTVNGDLYVASGTQASADQTSDCFDINCTDFLFGKNVSGSSQLVVSQSFIPNISEDSRLNKIELKLKKIGQPSDLTIRVMATNNGHPDKDNILTTENLSADLIPSNSDYDFYTVNFSSPPTLHSNTTYFIMLDPGLLDASNYWSIQLDSGSGYTSGNAQWSSDWKNSNWNSISGDFSFKTYMSGTPTSVTASNNATINGDVHANTISGLNIAKNAYYQTINNSTVHGHSFTQVNDPSPISFPISNADIDQLKGQATSIGITSGNKTITNCKTSLGPGEIEGDVTFDNLVCTLTVKSPLYITGNVLATNGVKLSLDSNNGANPGYIIVDGIVELNNNSKLSGSGSDGGYLMLVSTYDSAAHSQDAIYASNAFSGDIIYAPYGSVNLQNNTTFKEINAFKLTSQNTINLNYETGLTNLVFSNDLNKSYSTIRGTYKAD